MDWRIEAMRDAHMDEVLALERLSFSHPWGRSSMTAQLNSPFSHNYVANAVNCLDKKAVIAYICSQVVLDELSILKIAVSPSWREKGVGSTLLKECMVTAVTKGAVTAFLEVRPSNRTALAFYENLNFCIVGRRPNYYPETNGMRGEAALVMTKRLKEK